MYLEHFGLTEPPFRITPHPDFFFAGANRGATLDALIYAVTHDEGIVKISGEVGSGKTMLCRVLIERLPTQVAIAYLSNPSLSRDDIIYAIADELRIELPENARASAVWRVLQDHLIRLYGEGRRVVVLIDEAHAMPTETLEEIRLLSNLESNHSKLLQLVLFGQPELNDILARPDMRQLKERITHNFPLEPLVRDDIAEYMEFRMRAAGYRGPNVFSPSATKIVAQASQGLTRRINMLADKALLAAFSENTHLITAKHVRAAVKDCDFSKATRLAKPLPLRMAALLAILFFAIAGLALSRPWLPGKPEISPTVNMLAVPAPVPITPSSVALSVPPQPASPTSVETYLGAGKAWLARANNNHWFLQLATEANNAGRVEDYLWIVEKSGVDMSNVRVYLSDLSGTTRYSITYGDYASRAAAEATASRLPAKLMARHPYPRQVIRLR